MGAVSVPSKPLAICVRSQNGLADEPPQRQSTAWVCGPRRSVVCQVIGRGLRLAQYQRMVLMFLSSAQVHGLVIAVLDMEADGGLVEFAAGVEIRHVEHGVAGADDVERRIEDVRRNGHAVSPAVVIPGWCVSSNTDLDIPDSLRAPE